MDERGADLGSEDQPGIGDGVVETFFSHAVDREEQAVPSLIPDGDRENPREQVEGVLPVLFPCMGDDLSIRRCAEAVTRPQQAITNVRSVVDPAVQHDADGSLPVRRGLNLTLRRDDARAGDPESDATIDVIPPGVTASM